MSDASEIEVGAVLSIISRASNSQLTRFREAFKGRSETLNRLGICNIRTGMKVKWPQKDGTVMTGTVVKVKTKWVEVQAEKPLGSIYGGMRWNVVASLLTVVP